MLIIGAQKCGTTWLHRALSKSERFWGSEKKELMFWNHPSRDFSSYEKHFADASADAVYRFESTPTYFRLPGNSHDIAKEIRDGLGDIPLILMLRDPRARYLSAYTHHIMRGRLDETPVITELRDDSGMLSLGLYASILRHYKQYFSTINVHLYDDLQSDPFKLISDIFTELSVDLDLEPGDLQFKSNDKKQNQKRFKLQELPKLSPETFKELTEFYRDEIKETQQLIGRDLSHWLSADQ